MHLFKNLISSIILLKSLSKYQVITYTEQIKIPRKIQILAIIISLITYPKSFFCKPKEKLAVRITNLLQELGPIYIKFGQTLSTRPDLVGAEISNHLKALQDKLPPFDFEIVRKQFKEVFKTEISEIFAKFDKIPVAAASVAQVHKATFLNNKEKEVAVKILRPNIRKKYAKDIIFLEFIAKLITKFIKKTSRLKLNEVINVFRRSMNYELNLRLEAASASRFADNFAGDDTIHIPEIYWHLTSEEIITLEWIDGISIYDQEKLKLHSLNRKEIAAKMAIIFFNQAYRDGFFHADLHPGNVLIRKNGQIVLIDFGITGILPEKDRLAVAELLYAFLQRDYKLVAKIHHDVGYIPENTDLELFAQYCRTIAEPVLGLKIKDISIGNLLSQLFKVTEEFGMETQPQLLLLQKTMVVVEGIGQSLDPDINMWQLAEPWIKKWAIKNLTPEAKILRLVKKHLFHKL